MPSVTLIRYFYPNVAGWPWPREIITQHVSPAIFKIMAPIYWCHELDFTRSHDIIDHMITLFIYQYAISYWCPTGTEPLSATVNASKYIWVGHDLYLSGHVTSLFTWPFDSPGVISCRCSIVTESLSPAIFEIMGPKTPLTFLGHVTSSAICHFLLVFYWIRVSISSTVFEIFGLQTPCSHTHTPTHTETRRKWFHILSHAVYCIGQTKI